MLAAYNITSTLLCSVRVVKQHIPILRDDKQQVAANYDNGNDDHDDGDDDDDDVAAATVLLHDQHVMVDVDRPAVSSKA
jgi:hypothetical protein